MIRTTIPAVIVPRPQNPECGSLYGCSMYLPSVVSVDQLGEEPDKRACGADEDQRSGDVAESGHVLAALSGAVAHGHFSGHDEQPDESGRQAQVLDPRQDGVELALCSPGERRVARRWSIQQVE